MEIFSKSAQDDLSTCRLVSSGSSKTSEASCHNPICEEEHTAGEMVEINDVLQLKVDCSPFLGRSIHLSQETICFLDSQKCYAIPPPAVLEDLLRDYFCYFHPRMPILNECRFWEFYERKGHQIETWNEDQRISIFLLQAMLVVICSVRLSGLDAVMIIQLIVAVYETRKYHRHGVLVFHRSASLIISSSQGTFSSC